MSTQVMQWTSISVVQQPGLAESAVVRLRAHDFRNEQRMLAARFVRLFHGALEFGDDFGVCRGGRARGARLAPNAAPRTLAAVNAPPSLPTRLWLAWVAFFRVIFDGDFAAGVDATRALDLFRQADVPVVGIVENMAGYLCPHCGQPSDPFGSGGAEAAAREAFVDGMAQALTVAGLVAWAGALAALALLPRRARPGSVS